MSEGQAIVPAPEKHSFRGEYLDCFAVIENHLAPVVERLVELGQAKKAPLLFGLKFDLVLKSIRVEEVWQHRDACRPYFGGAIAIRCDARLDLSRTDA